ncbi:MAG: hypothetical protein ACREOO_02880 [bacterium]
MKKFLGREICPILAVALTLSCTPAATGQVATQQEKKVVVGKEQFSAKVLRVDAGRLELELTDAKEERIITLGPEMMAKLQLAPERRYDVLVNQRQTPGGITIGMRLKDERGLHAIAETIQDLPLLAPEEREGIKVEQLAGENRTLVYEDSCKSVYNVPTAFTIGNQRLILQAYESKTVQLGEASYTISLSASQFIALRECPIPFEGGRSKVDYTIVRNQ